ncbi:MAG TPA: GLUG motif-containing protein [Anaerohalosphaeraceae bacterium]|nr:GLUG motif-containing protein [Anaerohalosphaeraceae bacterium]
MVSGDLYSGGLVGENDGTITDSYSIGSVVGQYIGGLIGKNDSEVESSFWDVQNSNVSQGVGVGLSNHITGKTTAEMQMFSTFSSAGWDFSKTDGDEAEWWILSGKGYPRLVWEATIVIPDVVTKAQVDAEAALGEAGLKTEKIYMASYTIPDGHVISQSPASGQYVASGTIVDLVVSLGNPYAGNGTKEDPYQIKDMNDVLELAGLPEDYGKYFILTADIDMNGYIFNRAIIAPDNDAANDYFDGTAFTGVFDGKGHKIANFIIDGKKGDYVGLFGCTVGATIQNLGVENIDIGGRCSVGGLVGYNHSGNILSCYSTGSVNGSLSLFDCYVGGLVGENYRGQVKTCYSSCNVTGYDTVGGLVGDNFESTITSCFAAGTVVGNCNNGGLVGSNFFSMIASSYATGTVDGSLYDVGGLAGSNSDSAIISSYATGSVRGSENVGGLVGDNNQSTITGSYTTGSVDGLDCIGGLVGDNNAGIITSSYASGCTHGDNYVGGLVGYNGFGTITSSYAVGYVSGSSRVGGLVGSGYNSGSIVFSFWDVQASGQITSDGGIGKTTDEMHTPVTFIDAGWDFVDESANGLTDYWQMDAGAYPLLATHCWTMTGQGTSLDPYIIASGDDLGKIWLRPHAHYRLAGNLDLSGISWSTAVIPEFRGFIDGQGFIISNLTINRTGNNFTGLCGHTFDATIQNLGLEDVDITGGIYVGGLAGFTLQSTILSCYVTGVVSGSEYIVGGLIGGSLSCRIAGCYTDGLVSGSDSVGGLVGDNYGGEIETSCAFNAVSSFGDSWAIGGLIGCNGGTVTSCYSTGSVSGPACCIGGLIGENGNTITYCYASGSISGFSESSYVGGLVGWCGDYGYVSFNFWDMQNSGTSQGVGMGPASGITGKTTGQMQMVSTFTDAGWDFAGEADNGTEDIWRMCMDGAGYPRLSWEFGRRGDFACPDGVGVEDLEALGRVWLTAEGQAGYSGACDANGDGRIDMADFEVLAGEWMGD